VVASGDTAASIAAQHGLSLEALIRLNPGIAGNPALIFPGEVLALAEGAPSQLQARPPPPPPAAPATQTLSAPGAAVASGVLWTFDDCESFVGQGIVGRYIQTLRAFGIGYAIFFMTGDCFRSRPDLVAMIRGYGYEIGNHTAHHSNLVFLSLVAADAEIRGGPPGARYFRPPYGAHTPAIDSLVARLGYAMMLWTLDSGDTSPAIRGSCTAILATLRAGVRPGSIVLMHMHNPNSPSALGAFLAGRASC
jgi:peptidoglycan/xylan/chitin deacetylase (PgdA/CDA1 family)